MANARLLFILKHRDLAWGAGYSNTMSSGLRNSVRFVSDMLQNVGYESNWLEVIDNNNIDAAVAQYKPTHCIIEALWVVPEKFDVLMPLHPGVQWFVRNHSELPFLSQEGIAVQWIKGYLQRGVGVMCNTQRAVDDVKQIARSMGGIPDNLVTYAPNYYPVGHGNWLPYKSGPMGVLRVGCFGAIRPLKNHLLQGVAALRASQTIGMPVEFHMNTTRIEGNADPILNNMRALFTGAPNANLFEYGWLSYGDFVALMSGMDVSLQASFSETFNIVTADAVKAGVPAVVSPEISWLGDYAQADPTSSVNVANAMVEAIQTSRDQRIAQQRADLLAYSVASEATWVQMFQ